MAIMKKLSKKARIELGELRKPSDPDPIPFTRIRFLNNSGEPAHAMARTIDKDGNIEFDWLELNGGNPIPDGSYSGLDDGIDFTNAEDVVEVQFLLWFNPSSGSFWEFWSDADSNPIHGAVADSWFPMDQNGLGTWINCYKHVT